MQHPIALFKPYTGHDEKLALARVVESGWLGLGPETLKFEQAFAAYLGVRNAVSTNSCTAALVIALQLRGIGPGYKVAVPAITFCATAHTVKQVGAEPVLWDVNEQTLMLEDGHDVKGRMLEDADYDMVIPVLYAGQPDTYEWVDYKCIYDCAHAVGSTFDARGKLCCWSFHAVKNLSCGEGGMLTTDDDELAARARRLRWMGISKDTHERSKAIGQGGSYTWEYDVTEFGQKAHGNDLSAAVGLCQLKKLPGMQQRRTQLWQRYRQELGIMEWLPGHSSLLAVLRHPRRNQLMNHLRERGIGSGVHYRSLTLMSCYADQRGNCPVAERVWQELITLPLHPGLLDSEQDRVIEAVKAFGSA